MVYNTVNSLIMKKISEQDLIKLVGGTSTGECDYLQDMAADHVPFEDEAAERAWWDAWAEAFERCADQSH